MQVTRFALILSAFLFSSTLAMSQDKGTIRGTIFDGESGLTMIGAKVKVVDQSMGAMTDLDGKFSIMIAPGTYELMITFTGMDTIRITDVKVTSDEVVLFDNLQMMAATNALTTVVVTAEKVENTEGAVLSLKKSSTQMLDGISSANFKKIGDSDAAGAMRRVPGVSIAGGKYVYVRGLGDRYNKTVLNGVDIPGLDPDRNTLQMDIFPTTILDNIIVNKSFIAELPADFTGGIVDIGLKSFPDEQIRSVSLSGGYNPAMHFQSDYLDYDRGKTDFLGFDDGSRDIPTAGTPDSQIPQFADAIGPGADQDKYKQILDNFNPTMAAYERMSLMDMSLSLSLGNQFAPEGKDYKIGYNIIGSYRNQTTFYKEAEYARYNKNADPGDYTLDTAEYQIGNFGVNNALLSGMAGIAIKTNKSKYVLNVLHIQNGESSAGRFYYYNADQGSVFEGDQTNLQFTQRSMTNIFLGGKHDLYEKGWKHEWKISPTLSIMNDPDVRFTRYEIRNDSMVIGTEAGFPERIWRELNEKSVASKYDVEKSIKAWERDGKIKFGAAYTFKTRNYLIRNFQLIPRGDVPLTGDPDELLSEDLVWDPSNPFYGTTYAAAFIPNNPNQFTSWANVGGGYISTELSPSQRLKLTLGFRSEYYVQYYEGQNQTGSIVLDRDSANHKVLENLGWFPTINLVYAINEKQNMRFSFGKTIARPSFKELSYAEIYDPITGRTFIGGLFPDRNINGTDTTVLWNGELGVTDIYNADLRWEIFHGRGQTVSISAFGKYFINPIEIVQFTAQAGAFQPRNVGDGSVLGGEFELRQSLKFMSEKMENFSLTCNVTYTYSRIKYSATEKQSRIDNAKTGEVIGDYRDMAGQAPYLINAGLSYNGSTNKDAKFLKGFQAGVYYNVQGRTLQFVGIAQLPDIYTVPFHSLNLNMNKTFGEKENWSLGLRVTNLLMDKRESVYSSFGTQDQFFQSLAPGTSIRLKLGYSF